MMVKTIKVILFVSIFAIITNFVVAIVTTNTNDLDLLCPKGYAIFNCGNEEEECCYKKRSQYVAYVFQIFLGPSGIGMLYIRNYWLASSTFFFGLCSLILISETLPFCVLWILGTSPFPNRYIVYRFSLLLPFIVLVILYIVGLLEIAKGVDANGIPFYDY